MSRPRLVIVLVLLIVLAVTLAGAFLTNGVMAYLPFLQARKGKWTGAYVSHGIVDQRPWQTAATLAALAQSAEERELAREAERLADHEVDQAFSQSLRQASLAKPNLSGKALALQQRINELQETIKNDQAQIASLSAAASTKSSGCNFQWQRSGDCEGAAWPRPKRTGRFYRRPRPRKRRPASQASAGTRGAPSRYEAIPG